MASQRRSRTRASGKGSSRPREKGANGKSAVKGGKTPNQTNKCCKETSTHGSCGLNVTANLNELLRQAPVILSAKVKQTIGGRFGNYGEAEIFMRTGLGENFHVTTLPVEHIEVVAEHPMVTGRWPASSFTPSTRAYPYTGCKPKTRNQLHDYAKRMMRKISKAKTPEDRRRIHALIGIAYCEFIERENKS